ncbi:uncharacterized protein [Typha angustifolia]|uniref:uncharacterized protein isoform X1 n=1 Tax=Typha angustifolia TaxID=59011 RepID=UPI003C2E2E7A
MMNRSSNSSSDAAFVPSMMMSFVGLEPNNNNNNNNNHQKHQLWDWESTNPNPNPYPSPSFQTHNPLLFPNAPFLECPHSLLPMTASPYYSHQLPDCPLGLIKQEDASSGGGIGLNLGHRTYFSSADALAVDRLFARSRGFYSPPRCQAEGCGADLSGAKHYHRRHKVCEFHSKAAVVAAAGLQQRFCQQCSRFHVLAEFDEAKRSCRKRLADHNRRRRKPQETKNSATSSSERSKLNPKCTKDTSTASSTKSTTSISNTSVSLEKQEEYQNKATHFTSENTTHQVNGNNLLHLRQTMFEVDFM